MSLFSSHFDKGEICSDGLGFQILANPSFDSTRSRLGPAVFFSLFGHRHVRNKAIVTVGPISIFLS